MAGSRGAARPLARGASFVAAWMAFLAASSAAASGPVITWGFPKLPAPPASLDGTGGTASAIAAGQSYSCGIQAEDGAVVCWGPIQGDRERDLGQLTPPPSVDGTAGSAVAIAVGANHSCAIRADTGAVVCWGWQAGSIWSAATPHRFVDGTQGTASAIAAGPHHTCAIRAGHSGVVCWGDIGVLVPPSLNGQTGTASAIAAGGWYDLFANPACERQARPICNHNCAIQASTGAVVCWGNNTWGQASAPPSVNGTAGTATAIAAGGGFSCAIQTGSGDVVCWGQGAAAIPPPSVDGTTGTATAIAAGELHACAVQAGTGALVCWGDDGSGRATPPVGRGTALAAGYQHTVAIVVPACSDGLDSDGDGAIDYPADPGCDSPDDASERSPAFVCDDGVDNDGDGRADFFGDPGCDSLTDGSERGPNLICDDGIDDDGDGRVDFPDDPNCVDIWDPSENPVACDDGIDNDGNGLVDYPADPSCTDFNDESERVPPVFEVVKEHLEGAALMAGGDGNVYGWTLNAPWYDTPATMFQIDAGGTFRTAITFPPTFDWSGAPALGPDGAFYGTSLVYDSSSVSEFFRVDSQGNHTSLGQLPPLAPGWTPIRVSGLLLGSDGAFYGTGSSSCPGFCGSAQFLVKLTSDGHFTVVADADYLPWIPSVVGSDGALYGWRGAFVDGRAGGSLFRLDTAGTFSILQQFIEDPAGDLSNLSLGSDGLIYGVTQYGGPTSQGTVFRFDNAGNFTTLHEFSGADGAYPDSALTLGSDGAMYGVTSGGGSEGGGTVFRVDPVGTFTSLHSFHLSGGIGAPVGPLVLARDGVLYGTGEFGPVFFRVEPGGAVTSFLEIPSEFAPASPLVEGSDCALYGVANVYPESGRSDTAIYRIFEPGHLCQRVEFGSLPDRTLGDPPFTVSTTSSSGLPVSFTATGSCTVSGDQVTLTGVGTCTVTASQSGDARFGPADEVSQSFDVLFNFTGFLRPVMNPPIVNRVKAGRTVPIRFTLVGNPGRDVLAEDSPSVRPVPCDAAAPVNDVVVGALPGLASSLRYAPEGRYTYLWKTDPSWAGTCQELSLELIDGSVHRATFRFEQRGGRF